MGLSLTNTNEVYTFSPGQNTVPFCRSMMFPGRTHSSTLEKLERMKLPNFLRPRRLPAGSLEPAEKPPERFVAVRIPIGRVGLQLNVFRREGEEAKRRKGCRIIIAVEIVGGSQMFENGLCGMGADLDSRFTWKRNTTVTSKFSRLQFWK